MGNEKLFGAPRCILGHKYGKGKYPVLHHYYQGEASYAIVCPVCCHDQFITDIYTMAQDKDFNAMRDMVGSAVMYLADAIEDAKFGATSK